MNNIFVWYVGKIQFIIRIQRLSSLFSNFHLKMDQPSFYIIQDMTPYPISVKYVFRQCAFHKDRFPILVYL